MILLKRLRLSSILFSVMSSYNIWSYLVVVTMMVTLVVTVTMVMLLTKNAHSLAAAKKRTMRTSEKQWILEMFYGKYKYKYKDNGKYKYKYKYKNCVFIWINFDDTGGIFD